jgi:hypothetical protein
VHNNNTRLRIATRIHFALLRHLGEGVDVAVMLKREAEAREVLWVCDASADPELMSLAHQYRRAVELEARPGTASAHAPQDASWSKDTSGFGLTQPPESPAPTPTPKVPTGHWLNPAKWLRRSAH